MRQGDILCAFTFNTIEYPFFFYATNMLGGIFTTASPYNTDGNVYTYNLPSVFSKNHPTWSSYVKYMSMVLMLNYVKEICWKYLTICGVSYSNVYNRTHRIYIYSKLNNFTVKHHTSYHSQLFFSIYQTFAVIKV